MGDLQDAKVKLTVDTSLMLLREIAGNLTIAPAAADREPGWVEVVHTITSPPDR